MRKLYPTDIIPSYNRHGDFRNGVPEGDNIGRKSIFIKQTYSGISIRELWVCLGTCEELSINRVMDRERARGSLD